MVELVSHILAVAKKEFRVYFASPAAYLFLATFLAAALFVFFRVEAFFARNIADVRPLFQWLPVLLIFLIATLTMRTWPEGRHTGTLESLLTAPTRPLSLVLGKFVAVLGLVAVALALTLPLPITVAMLGPLDWGSVIGGYVATLFLAAAYISIGLAMSARRGNPTMALILTVVVCGAFYLIGAPTLTGLFSRDVASVMSLLGTGARFEPIQRGMLDLRDLYYYVSIAGVFLTLNYFMLKQTQFASKYYLWATVYMLIAFNFVAANLWLAQINWGRFDIAHARTSLQLDTALMPLTENERRAWEYANYGFAMLGLLIVLGWRRRMSSPIAIVTNMSPRRHEMNLNTALQILAEMLVLQLLLAYGLHSEHIEMAAAQSGELLLVSPADKIDRIAIAAADGSGIELKKADRKWTLAADTAMIDAHKIKRLTDKLQDIKPRAQVATSPGTLKGFKVSDNHFDRRITLSSGDKTFIMLYLGSQSESQAYVRRADQMTVYVIGLSLDDVSTRVEDWKSAQNKQ